MACRWLLHKNSSYFPIFNRQAIFSGEPLPLQKSENKILNHFLQKDRICKLDWLPDWIFKNIQHDESHLREDNFEELKHKIFVWKGTWKIISISKFGFLVANWFSYLSFHSILDIHRTEGRMSGFSQFACRLFMSRNCLSRHVLCPDGEYP